MSRLIKFSAICFLIFTVLSGLVFVYYKDFKRSDKTSFAPAAEAAGPFTCGTDIITLEGVDYNTVQIGTQCWLKKNLQVTRNPAGIPITRYCYENNVNNCNTDGGLYDWNTAMNGSINEGAQGICPNGWHIPKDSDWHTLENYLTDGVNSCVSTRQGLDCADAGTKIKQNGLNDFSGILAGHYHITVNEWWYRGSNGYFWSSTEFPTNNAFAIYRYFGLMDNKIGRSWNEKAPYAASIRCVKDTAASSVASSGNVFGFAWSENIGWISFNSKNCDSDGNNITDTGNNAQCPVGLSMNPYGVRLNLSSANKELSGYAWSPNIGWISFNKTETGNPPGAPYNGAETYIAKYDPITNLVSGWARALSFGSGWDGWIKLGSGVPGVTYGVSLVGGDFMGWAWGNDMVGWISFNSINCDTNLDNKSEGVGKCPVLGTPMPRYKVYIYNTNPTVVAGAPWSPDYCIASPNNIILSWVFSDAEDLNIQTAYQLIITRDDGLVYNSGKVTGLPGGSTSINGSAVNLIIPGFISYGHSYTWTIQVWDSGNLSDGPKAGAGFSTPVHAYPNADFSFTPISPALTDNVLFTPISNIGYSPYIHDWDFDYNSGIDSFNTPNPMFNYSAIGSYQVFHKITDKDGNICTRIMPINVGAGAGGLKWEEVVP